MSLATAQLILLFFTFLSAICCGGRPERSVTSIFLLAMILDRLAHQIPFIAANLNFTVWHLVLEILLTTAVLIVALKADRFWPMFVGSFQIVALIAMMLQAIGIGSQPLVWAILNQVPTWLAIALTLYGILSQRRARKIQPER